MNFQPNHAPLRFLRVDQGPLLHKIYELRYEVYCLGRGFLPPECFPSGAETDEFDKHAMHFAALDRAGQVVGTARVVLSSKAGLPLDRYFAKEGDLHFRGVPRRCLGEVSRLAVRAPFRKSGAGDGKSLVENRSRIALGLYKEIYQASRKAGLTHLLAAMEVPLERLLSRHALPFKVIGPEIDYYGPVRPYLLDIAAGERALFARCPNMFREFVEGLSQSVRPAWFDAGSRFVEIEEVLTRA